MSLDRLSDVRDHGTMDHGTMGHGTMDHGFSELCPSRQLKGALTN